MGGDVCITIQNIFRHGIFPQGLNDSFFVLIPKTTHFTTFNQLRPIALCNTLYKVFSKILVNRLRPLLQNLISLNQAAFVPGRWIGENVILMQEIAHSMKIKKGLKGFLGIKVDLQKAYDRVDWNILLQVLEAFGFDNKFKLLIFRCVSSSNIKMLLNGSPFGQIPLERGIRQGDPLSPFLFVLFLELLSRMLLKLEADGDIQGIKLNRLAPSITHLLFADDILIFCEASAGQA